MAKVTMKQLIQLDACEEFKTKFQDVFGDEAEVTVENGKRMDGLYRGWIYSARPLLSKEGRHTLNAFLDTVQHTEPARLCVGCQQYRDKWIELYNKENDRA